MDNIQTINEKIKELPPDLQLELEKYLNYLLSQNKRKDTSKMLKQDWGGGMKDLKEKYTSLELQKLAMKWRMK